MFCPKCGKENQNTNKFCKSCGKPLPDVSQIRQATAQFQYHSPPQGVNLIGQVLDGKYRIDAKLGSGGMGDVYRATRLLIGDAVAIKILHAHLASDANAAERFRREAVTATQLRHRNIVGLYDVGIFGALNVPYILMELAEGFSLRQIINQYRVLPLDFVVTVAAQVCAALDEAHRLGIIHRDIKPENVIANQTTTGWHIKILDFGIAKLYNQTDRGLTQDGSAMGTPQYMSPEQCMGEERLDGRSDIYSVGIMLYELLCGTVPFKSPAASAVAIQQVQNQPAFLRSHNPDVPPQVEETILRALEKSPESRHQTALQLSQEMIRAATEALKSGLVEVPNSPVAKPQVAPEYDPGVEEESPRIPTPAEEFPQENKSESRIVLGNQKKTQDSPDAEIPAQTDPEDTDKQSADDKEISPAEPPHAPAEMAQTRVEQEEKPAENCVVSDENAGVDFAEVEKELPLVFQDAERILDEIFPNEAEIRDKIKPETIEFYESPPIAMPDEPLPKILEKTSDDLAKYKAETIVAGAFDDKVHQTITDLGQAEKRVEEFLSKLDNMKNGENIVSE